MKIIILIELKFSHFQSFNNWGVGGGAILILESQSASCFFLFKKHTAYKCIPVTVAQELSVSLLIYNQHMQPHKALAIIISQKKRLN